LSLLVQRWQRNETLLENFFVKVFNNGKSSYSNSWLIIPAALLTRTDLLSCLPLGLYIAGIHNFVSPIGHFWQGADSLKVWPRLHSVSLSGNFHFALAKFSKRKNMNLSLIGTAYGQVATQTGLTPKGPSLVEQLVLPIGLLVIMWFFVIRPQSKKMKDHRQFLDGMKPGDEVITSSGIIGRIKSIQDGVVSLDAGGSSFRVIRDHITGAFTKSEPEKNKSALIS